MLQNEQKEIQQFAVQGGTLYYAWQSHPDDSAGKWGCVLLFFIGLVFLLGPIWFIATAVLTYLYFFK